MSDEVWFHRKAKIIPTQNSSVISLICRLEKFRRTVFEHKVGHNVEHNVGQPLGRMVNRSLSDRLFQRVVQHAVRHVIRNVGRIVEQSLGRSFGRSFDRSLECDVGRTLVRIVTDRRCECCAWQAICSMPISGSGSVSLIADRQSRRAATGGTPTYTNGTQPDCGRRLDQGPRVHGRLDGSSASSP
jgi:hypothetical protein